MKTHPLVHSGAGVVSLHNDRVLLVQLNYGPFKGHWILPGGMLEDGEHPHEAAVREFKEETNLEVRVERLLAIRSRIESARASNVYWVFKGTIETPLPEQHLAWPKSELMCVEFWTIADCFSSMYVRPHTKNYIKMLFESQNVNSIQKFDQSFNDFVYKA
jgi:ADP-ribose pyrophosphatase YjhB (NUDIX family)